MAHLNNQFTKALAEIEPDSTDKTNAPLAHERVREVLERDDQLREYGADTILIGSYKRSVSIKRMKDVDVFTRLPDIPSNVDSQDLLDHVFTVLNSEFGEDADGHRRAKRQDRSVQVSFPEYDLYVDAVPARPTTRTDGAWEIPQRGESNAWVPTNPDKLTSLTTAMNSTHGGFYVRTVKLMRQVRRNLLNKGAKPGGFFIEIATYNAFSSGGVSGTDHAEYFVSALEAVSTILDEHVRFGTPLPDPTMDNASIAVRATPDEFATIRTQFASAAINARDALNDDDPGTAAVAFRKLLGKDPDGQWLFEMPPGYNEDGTKKASIEPGSKDVPGGSRRYG
jgi:hypothetical protein